MAQATAKSIKDQIAQHERALQDSDPAVRVRAAEALGALGAQVQGHRGALGELGIQTSHADPAVRHAAVAALAKIGGTWAAYYLAGYLNDDDLAIASDAAQALQRFPLVDAAYLTRRIEVALRAARSGAQARHVPLIEGLLRHLCARGAGALIAALISAPTWSERAAAAEQLDVVARYAPTHAARIIHELALAALYDPEDRVRRAAQATLIELAEANVTGARSEALRVIDEVFADWLGSPRLSYGQVEEAVAAVDALGGGTPAIAMSLFLLALRVRRRRHRNALLGALWDALKQNWRTWPITDLLSLYEGLLLWSGTRPFATMKLYRRIRQALGEALLRRVRAAAAKGSGATKPELEALRRKLRGAFVPRGSSGGKPLKKLRRLLDEGIASR